MLPVRDIEVMFIENASIQSAGESPIFTWTGVFAVGVGFDPVPEVELFPPPHAVNKDVRKKARQAIAAVVVKLCWAALCIEGGWW